ncbi:MAG: hypothetical protein J6V98_02290 [Bacteroidales bacterium]|nr:hypothetical protein [Bacteroidales bacterium]
MKKTILLIAAALLLCGEIEAQNLTAAATANPATQLGFAEDLQAGLNSIYTMPMPTSDFAVKEQLGTNQLASRKGWGIACIITGGMTLVGGVTTWLGADMFNNATSQMSASDPDFQEGQQAVQAVGNGIKTIGIVGTVVGAALVGTGIWLVSSDGGSSYRRGGHSRSRYRRFADSMPASESAKSDWGLRLNVGPASSGLTLVF